MFSSLRELQTIFGGGPLAALAGLLVVAVLGLFWALVKSWREHLATTKMLIPIASKMESTAAENTRVLREAVAALQDATILLQAAMPKRRREGKAHAAASPASEPPPKLAP